jgi:hypothetical protein
MFVITREQAAALIEEHAAQRVAEALQAAEAASLPEGKGYLWRANERAMFNCGKERAVAGLLMANEVSFNG